MATSLVVNIVWNFSVVLKLLIWQVAHWGCFMVEQNNMACEVHACLSMIVSTCTFVVDRCDNEVICLLHMCNIQVFLHLCLKNPQHNQLFLLWCRQVQLAVGEVNLSYNCAISYFYYFKFPLILTKFSFAIIGKCTQSFHKYCHRFNWTELNWTETTGNFKVFVLNVILSQLSGAQHIPYYYFSYLLSISNL